jgi:coenzyme PQQ precursor peptide PqqA
MPTCRLLPTIWRRGADGRRFGVDGQSGPAKKPLAEAADEDLFCRYGLPGPILGPLTEETTMAWTTPTLVEICIGLEINGYLPAEF